MTQSMSFVLFMLLMVVVMVVLLLPLKRNTIFSVVSRSAIYARRFCFDGNMRFRIIYHVPTKCVHHRPANGTYVLLMACDSDSTNFCHRRLSKRYQKRKVLNDFHHVAPVPYRSLPVCLNFAGCSLHFSTTSSTAFAYLSQP